VLKLQAYASTKDWTQEPIRPPDNVARKIWPIEATPVNWPPDYGLNGDAPEIFASETFH
jgi:hypothetical protein